MSLVLYWSGAWWCWLGLQSLPSGHWGPLGCVEGVPWHAGEKWVLGCKAGISEGEVCRGDCRLHSWVTTSALCGCWGDCKRKRWEIESEWSDQEVCCREVPSVISCLPYEGLRKAHGERFTCCLFVTSRGDGEDPFSKMPKARMESRGHKLATRNSHLTSSSFQAIPSLDDSEGSGGTWRSLPTSLPCLCTHARGHLCNVCSYICNVEGHRLSLGTLHLAELVGSEAEWAIPTNIHSMQGLHPGGVCIGADRKHKNHGCMREDGFISDEHRVMSGVCTGKGRENPLSRPAWGPGVLSLLAELWGCLYDIHTFRHHSWWLYRSLQLN